MDGLSSLSLTSGIRSSRSPFAKSNTHTGFAGVEMVVMAGTSEWSCPMSMLTGPTPRRRPRRSAVSTRLGRHSGDGMRKARGFPARRASIETSESGRCDRVGAGRGSACARDSWRLGARYVRTPAYRLFIRARGVIYPPYHPCQCPCE